MGYSPTLPTTASGISASCPYIVDRQNKVSEGTGGTAQKGQLGLCVAAFLPHKTMSTERLLGLLLDDSAA